MAHKAKLEVYKISIISKNNTDLVFKDLFIDKFEGGKIVPDSELFLDYFKNFIESIDAEEFIEDNKKNKAFTAYDSDPVGKNPTIIVDTARKIVEGTIEGGKFGLRRNKSSIGNKKSKDDIYEKDIIMDKFYFNLYTPLNSNIGVLLLQSYTSESISDIFRDFVVTFFKFDKSYKKPKIEKFVPVKFIEEFKEASKIKSFAFSSRFIYDEIGGDDIGTNDSEFVVKVEVISAGGIEKSKLNNWIKRLKGLGVGKKKLEDFKDSSIRLRNSKTSKESSFKLNKDCDIRPVIYLEDENLVGVDGIPDFKALKQYCKNLLENEIIPELYLDNEIKEH